MPAEQRQYDLLASRLREELGEGAFQEARDEAATWSWEDVLANVHRLLGKCGVSQSISQSISQGISQGISQRLNVLT